MTVNKGPNPPQRCELSPCQHCGISTIFDHGAGLCEVCASMLAAVKAQPGLVVAHQEFEAENDRRAKAKQRMLRQDDLC